MERNRATAEMVNVDAKQNRRLDMLSVRGIGNVLAITTLFALTYGILRPISLGG